MKAFEFRFKRDGSFVFSIGIGLEVVSSREYTEMGIILGERGFFSSGSVGCEKIRLHRFEPPECHSKRVCSCEVCWITIPPRNGRSSHMFLTLKTERDCFSSKVVVRVRTECSRISSSPGEVLPLGDPEFFLVGHGRSNLRDTLGGIWSDCLIGIKPGDGVLIRPAGFKQDGLTRVVLNDPKEGPLCMSELNYRGRSF